MVVVLDICHPARSYPFPPHSPYHQPPPFSFILATFPNPHLLLARSILPRRDHLPCDPNPLVDMILMFVEHRA